MATFASIIWTFTVSLPLPMVADPGIVQVIGILLNHSVNIVGILSHLLLLSILII